MTIEELVNKKTYYYDLPEELIAQDPLLKRDESRLLIFNRNNGDIEHKTFRNILDYLKPNDCLVINNTRVIPARLIGRKIETGAKIEIFLLKDLGNDCWETLTKPGRKALPGVKFAFGDNEELVAEIKEVKDDGNRIVKFYYEGIFNEVLD